MLNSAPRKGLTLLEVLITIFVMAIGFLSVLTLFPIAARKLARSIDSDRATLMAGNAEAALKLLNYPSIAAQQMDLFLSTLAKGDPRRLQPSGIYLIDPSGDQDSGNLTDPFVNQSIVRVPAPFAREWIVSQDEMRFDPTGKPEDLFRRGERYTSSFMFRRRQLNDPDSCECLVLVYTGRPVEFGNKSMIGLNILSNNPDGITVTDPSGTNATSGPDRVLGRTSWIMDVSLDNGVRRWKKFHQVQSTDLNGNSLSLTLDPPPDPAVQISEAIWVDYLFDWFDRGVVK